MSELIKCDMCGELIAKEEKFEWHKVTIVSSQNYGFSEINFHLCTACKKDVEKMLHK